MIVFFRWAGFLGFFAFFSSFLYANPEEDCPVASTVAPSLKIAEDAGIDFRDFGKRLLISDGSKVFADVRSEEIIESLRRNTVINTRKKEAFGQWMEVFEPSAEKKPLPKNIHVVWRDNYLPDYYVCGLLGLCSDALESGWTVHFWTNRPSDIFNKWVVKETNGFEKKIPELAEQMRAQVAQEENYTLEEATAYLDTIVRRVSKRYDDQKQMRKLCDGEYVAGGMAAIRSLVKQVGPVCELERLRTILNPTDLEKSSLEARLAAVGCSFSKDLRMHFSKFFIREFSKKEISALHKNTIHHFFKLDVESLRKEERVPEEIRDHLKRLQKTGAQSGQPVFQIHGIDELYKEACEVLEPDLYHLICQIIQFEGRGIKNYGSWTDIDRKLIMMLYGGAYVDLDGIQLKLLPTEILQNMHAFNVPLNNNDPYFSHPSQEMWQAILWEIVSRYECMDNLGLLRAKKRQTDDQTYTVFATGPGLMCPISGCGDTVDAVTAEDGWTNKITKKDYKKLTEKDYKEYKSIFIVPTTRGIFEKYGVEYETNKDGFRRAVFFANSWVEPDKTRKKPSFVAPDTLSPML